MHQLRRKAAATAAVVSLLVGSAMLTFPANASADTKKVECGGEVTANPGDEIVATMDGVLGLLKFDLGTVPETTTVLTSTAGDLITDTLGMLSDTVCHVTVTVADTVEPVPGVGGAASDTLKQGAEALNQTTQGTVGALDQLTPPSGPQQSAPGSDPPSGGSGNAEAEPNGSQNSGDTPYSIASPASPAIGGGVPLHPAFLPLDFSSGYAPMRDYTGIPLATPGMFAPAPGIRYGSGVPGYQPEFDILGQDNAPSEQRAPEQEISKAGEAKALPPSGPDAGGNPASLPVLLAVIALAGSTAGLVRTWVLRRA